MSLNKSTSSTLVPTSVDHDTSVAAFKFSLQTQINCRKVPVDEDEECLGGVQCLLRYIVLEFPIVPTNLIVLHIRVSDRVWCGHAKGHVSVWDSRVRGSLVFLIEVYFSQLLQTGSVVVKIPGSTKEKEKIYSLLLVDGKVWSCSDERYTKCVIRVWDPNTVNLTGLLIALISF